ncbi:MAG: S-adenosylhomocysteine hydrolase [Rheinheimera sp.]|nr:S-adenosylhomocysteine hydrolase [Rheinheimera sp.]
MTILDRLQTRVKRAKRSVFLRSDFTGIADYDQVGRGLRSLVQEGLLLKIGYGLYARARVNRITGQLMPDNPAGNDGVLIEAMERLGVDYQLDSLSLKSLSGESTQIPASVKIIPKSSRFTRKIAVGKQRVNEIR